MMIEGFKQNGGDKEILGFYIRKITNFIYRRNEEMI